MKKVSQGAMKTSTSHFTLAYTHASAAYYLALLMLPREALGNNTRSTTAHGYVKLSSFSNLPAPCPLRCDNTKPCNETNSAHSLVIMVAVADLAAASNPRALRFARFDSLACFACVERFACCACFACSACSACFACFRLI